MPSTFVTKSFSFSAAHKYGHKDWTEEKNEEIFGPDAKLHGHNYILEVTVTGEINPDTGFIVDLGHLKEVVNEKIVNRIDHSHFEKKIDWFKDKQPSSENLTKFIWGEIESHLEGCRLHRVRLKETDTIYTDYYGPAGGCK
ncbi:MAG: 6-carboxytetrahydropterin synthase [Candidatus Marinimicrobia bacterium]|nr:6-carboxytetrahydropterin synthase [Candidatus Neomarinimicrobiota bacterium]